MQLPSCLLCLPGAEKQCLSGRHAPPHLHKVGEAEALWSQGPYDSEMGRSLSPQCTLEFSHPEEREREEEKDRGRDGGIVVLTSTL